MQWGSMHVVSRMALNYFLNIKFQVTSVFQTIISWNNMKIIWEIYRKLSRKLHARFPENYAEETILQQQYYNEIARVSRKLSLSPPFSFLPPPLGGGNRKLFKEHYWSRFYVNISILPLPIVVNNPSLLKFSLFEPCSSPLIPKAFHNRLFQESPFVGCHAPKVL